jgi:hypothetical protein
LSEALQGRGGQGETTYGVLTLVVATSSSIAFASFAMAGWLLGLAAGLFSRELQTRVIVGVALLLVFVGTIVAGVLLSESEAAVTSPVFGAAAAAGWLVGVVVALLVRLRDRGHSNRAKRDSEQKASDQRL